MIGPKKQLAFKTTCKDPNWVQKQLRHFEDFLEISNTANWSKTIRKMLKNSDENVEFGRKNLMIFRHFLKHLEISDENLDLVKKI